MALQRRRAASAPRPLFFDSLSQSNRKDDGARIEETAIRFDEESEVRWYHKGRLISDEPWLQDTKIEDFFRDGAHGHGTSNRHQQQGPHEDVEDARLRLSSFNKLSAA